MRSKVVKNMAPYWTLVPPCVAFERGYQKSPNLVLTCPSTKFATVPIRHLRGKLPSAETRAVLQSPRLEGGVEVGNATVELDENGGLRQAKPLDALGGRKDSERRVSLGDPAE